MQAIVVVAAIAAAIAAGPAAAIYKCQINGETVFSQTPCAADAEKVEVKTRAAPENDLEQELRSIAGLGKVAPGMTPTLVRYAWGEPTSIHRSVHSSVTTEQWVYRRGPGVSQYVHFRDGVVSSVGN